MKNYRSATSRRAALGVAVSWNGVRAALVLATVSVCVVSAAAASTPGGASPPAYDYDAVTPGLQPPTSPLVANYDYRSLRTYQVTFPVLVPKAELQAIMPKNFDATPSSTGATTSTLSMAFFIDQRFERVGTGTFGPVSGVLVSTVATNKVLGQSELVFPAFEASDEIAALNDSFGDGAAKQAKVRVTIEQSDGKTRFVFTVKDALFGLDVTASATSPSAVNTRSISDPVGLAFRTFDGTKANASFRAASQSDTLPLSPADARAKLVAARGKLNFPGGSLTVLGLAPNITFARNVEFIIKLPPR
jgi:hypothetical protein